MSGKENKQKLSTEPYKGVRDFYPEDMAVENYIFGVWRKTAESFGYQEYNASVLEPTELYRAKSGDEIINEQTYSFKDRGEREVTLRPEMTPTVARMIAAKRKELKFPVRWYSIPNLFRYEKPQRGRLREHFQLNCDLFGLDDIQADIEIISLASQIMRNFGLKDDQFEIRVNYAGLLSDILKKDLEISEQKALELIKILDKRNKLDSQTFIKSIVGCIGEVKNIRLNDIFGSDGKLVQWVMKDPRYKWCNDIIEKLKLKNGRLDLFLTRGFDYYTGLIFEIYDKGLKNPRALFGGGRYDNLLYIFNEEKVPAVGFGMGDVGIKNVLETYGLLPQIPAPADLYLCPLSEKETAYAEKLAMDIRSAGARVAVDYSGKKVGEQIKYADKYKIPFIAVIGENEMKTGAFKIKNLASGVETDATAETAAAIVLS